MNDLQQELSDRLRAFHPEMGGGIANLPPSPKYFADEEALLAILREQAEADPVFGERWGSGRCSPSDICIVLAPYVAAKP